MLKIAILYGFIYVFVCSILMTIMQGNPSYEKTLLWGIIYVIGVLTGMERIERK